MLAYFAEPSFLKENQVANEALTRELKGKALQLRRNVLEMIGIGNAGHWGGSSSLAELMAVLYFHSMKIDRNNPKAPERDRLLTVVVVGGGFAGIEAFAELREHFSEKEIVAGSASPFSDWSLML